MRLYHAGSAVIPEPDLRRGRKNADFGQGFYLTPDLAFARRWAAPGAFINEYELNEDGLLIHRFRRDGDWFDYIFNNRRARDGIRADAVIGPIANDTIFETFGIISSGFLKPADAMRLLMIGPEYTQVALKTEKAAGRLRWIRADEAPRPDPETRRAEQHAYDISFAEVLQEIMGAS